MSGSPVTIEQVRESLLSLYSPTDLGKSALAEALPESASIRPLAQRAQVVRDLMLDAIQAMRSANQLAPSPFAARAYDLLRLRYVSGLAMDDVAYELSLSLRQVYRNLRWAEERVTEVLNSRSVAREALPDAQPAGEALTEEIETMARSPELVSLQDFVAAAVGVVSPVAQHCGVALHYTEPRQDILVRMTPAILKQVLIQLLSSLVQNAGGGEAWVGLVGGEPARLVMRLDGASRLKSPDLVEAAVRVANAQGIYCRFEQGASSASLHLGFAPAARHRVLIVEDKPGARALYQRYLENSEFEVLFAASPALAGELAVSERANVILLDIMMPEMDGWTVLQTLKLDPRLRPIPVVICSVINDRQLGVTLGAAGYLTKPIARPDLLDCLREVCRARVAS